MLEDNNSEGGDSNSDYVNELSQTITMANDNEDFFKMMTGGIRNNFAADPQQLAPFVASINFLKTMATTLELLETLKMFIMTKLEGRAI